MQERLQKILSKCGIASRRKAEEIILEGRVTVNGKVASLGMKADLSKDHIKVDGKLIRGVEPKVYIAFNKPVNCITSMSDPQGRVTIKDYIKKVRVKVFPVGRLDYDSEGLVLLTNDGELANAIMHPRRHIPKTYLVKIKGKADEKDLKRIKEGVRLRDGLTAPAQVRKMRKQEVNSWLEVVIFEGKKHQVRRMFEKIGHPVLKLKRTKINGITLGGLPAGSYRYLTPDEIARLKKEVFKK
jgi:23S rRNA pseudouridine2605 synthase